MNDHDPKIDILELSADIVASYVSNNSVTAGDLPALIAAVHASLHGLSTGKAAAAETEKQLPAVSIRKSRGEDFLICLEDGKKFKSLKRHLRTTFNMSPDDYRAKWGLPSDYPMVAPAYAAIRSELAKASGLGNQRRKAIPEPVKKGRKAKAGG